MTENKNNEWTSKNGRWKISKPGRWMIEDLMTGFCDYPSVVGVVPAYDHPEQIPRYVKDVFERISEE